MIRNAIIKQGAAYSGERAARTIGGPRGLLSRMEPFTSGSSGNMRAERFDGGEYHDSVGRLPNEWVSDLRSIGVIYVVFSYFTPIAWVKDEGGVVVPDKGYSVTTTHHQNLCKAWLNPSHEDMIKAYALLNEGKWL